MQGRFHAQGQRSSQQQSLLLFDRSAIRHVFANCTKAGEEAAVTEAATLQNSCNKCKTSAAIG